jgi:hypothetical protein
VSGALLTGNVEFVTGGVVADADFDNNAIVDGRDFLIWQRNIGVGTSNAMGDANGDSAVNAADLAVWRTQFGGSPPAEGALAAVPEPGAAVLALIWAMTYVGGRKRHIGA